MKLLKWEKINLRIKILIWHMVCEKKNRVRQGFLHVFISVLTTARTTGKCGPEKTPYFDTFHVVRLKLTVQK